MIRRTPISTRTDTLLPDTTLFRSPDAKDAKQWPRRQREVQNREGKATSSHVGSGVAKSAVCHHSRNGLKAEFLDCLRRIINGMKGTRSEEHTSELQSLMRISYAVFCLKKKNRELVEEQQ